MRYITVDDKLPIETYYWYADDSSIINSGMSDNGAWWMPVLEKGFAKYMKDYLAMDGGWETVALRALTGMPSDRFKTTELTEQEVYDTIAENDDNNNIITAACLTAVSGLVPGHAYTVLGVNKTDRRIILRNPWSSEEYYGVGADQTDDGVFEVPPSIFVEAFPNFSIAYYKDWVHTEI